MSQTLVVIPARLNSARLPGKPLRDLGGVPLLAYTVQAAIDSGYDWAVATSDPQVSAVCMINQWPLVFLRDEYPTGSDRAFAACEEMGAAKDCRYDRLVNLQCDEWLATGEDIRAVAESLESPWSMATMDCPLDAAELQSVSGVKVVSVDGPRTGRRAIYFSRAPLAGAGLHVGIYGYTSGGIESMRYGDRSPLELAENLEQLRAIHRGLRIRIVGSDRVLWSINTREDLDRATSLVVSGRVRRPFENAGSGTRSECPAESPASPTDA